MRGHGKLGSSLHAHGGWTTQVRLQESQLPSVFLSVYSVHDQQASPFGKSGPVSFKHSVVESRHSSVGAARHRGTFLRLRRLVVQAGRQRGGDKGQTKISQTVRDDQATEPELGHVGSAANAVTWVAWHGMAWICGPCVRGWPFWAIYPGCK